MKKKTEKVRIEKWGNHTKVPIKQVKYDFNFNACYKKQ